MSATTLIILTILACVGCVAIINRTFDFMEPYDKDRLTTQYNVLLGHTTAIGKLQNEINGLKERVDLINKNHGKLMTEHDRSIIVINNKVNSMNIKVDEKFIHLTALQESSQHAENWVNELSARLKKLETKRKR